MSGTLIGAMMSQPTRACLHVARLLGVNVSLQQIAKGEQASKEFKTTKNPNAKFPVLTTNTGFTLYESTAIARYICNKAADGSFPSSHGQDTAQAISEQLFPSNPEVRARVDQVLDWHHGVLRIGAAGQCRRVVLQHVLPPAHSCHLDLKQTAPERDTKFLNLALDVLDQQLENSLGPYLCSQDATATDSDNGERGFTLADIFAFHELVQVRALITDPNLNCNLNGRTRIVEWMSRMDSIPHTAELVQPFLDAVPGLLEKAQSASS